MAIAEAARAVGLSESTVRRDVLPQVRSVKVARQPIVAILELERWLYLNGRLAVDE
jgi:DeoR/GlpR family transcriptional regulator of sugar metabolism